MLLEAGSAGGPVHELRLTVPNRPGIVAQVALELGRAGVNIVDMALAPASDMRTGAMTLWIAGDSEARPRARADRSARLPGRQRVSSTVRFDPAGPLRGSYTPPPDKSISHRAALFGAMADEPVTVANYLDSEDTRSTLDAVMTLGAGVEEERDGLRADPRRGPARAARGHRRAHERGQRRAR